MSDDTIYRRAAIDALCDNCDNTQAVCAHFPCKQYIAVEKLPSAQAKLDENDMPEQGDSSELGVKTGETCTDCVSRQAAIDFIAAGHLCNPNEPRWSDNEVVNFLKSRPSAQPDVPDTNVGDMISRRAAIDAMINSRSNADVTLVPGSYTNGWRDGRKLLLDELLQVVFELPSAQRTGRWVEHMDYPGIAYVCSECNYFTTLKSYYCPYCGADMRGEQDE